MAGYIGVFGAALTGLDDKALINSIDRLGLCNAKTFTGPGWLLSAAWNRNTPFAEARYLDNSNWDIVLAGDPVTIGGDSTKDGILWDKIVSALENRNYKFFMTWRGAYSIAAYDKKNQRILAITDRKAQMPIFYWLGASGLWISTELSSVLSIPSYTPKINRRWLYDFFYFNFGLFGSTYLDQIVALAPSSVLEYQIPTGQSKVWSYSEIFRKKERLLGGKRAYESAYEIFQERIPEYYKGVDRVACALTSGWDARTLLAFRPNNEKVLAYTYGMPGTEDLVEAAHTAELIGVEHRSIVFGDEFIGELGNYLYYTVFLSSGLQNIARSTLSYIYGVLTNFGTQYPVTLSGVSGDLQFRGHRCVPTPISYGLGRAFETGKTDANDEPWRAMWGDGFHVFEEHVMDRIVNLTSLYGPIESMEHQLSYLIYEGMCKYYAGEFALARQFTSIRTPYTDDDIVDLAYSIREGTIGFSRFRTIKGLFRENILEAYVISRQSPELARIPIRGVPPKVARFGYWAGVPYKLATRVPAKLRRTLHAIPIEDWTGWLNSELKPLITDLVYDKDSRVRQYLNVDSINTLPPPQRSNYTMKLLTLEIILRLIETRWQAPEEATMILSKSMGE